MSYPHEVEIGLNVDGGQDSNTGEQIPGGFDSIGTFEAEVAVLTGTEFLEAQKIENSVDYNVVLDYDSRIKTEQIVKWKGLVMEIKFIQPVLTDIDGEWEQVILKCSS